ncbi:MAG TPA: S8 family peptidase [Solirubrobacteraceae bacterium]|nr:S8 family peptidase [Solirubrobacteraceae bacterium]
MTRSVQIVERMRWMSALAGAAVLALLVSLALGASSVQLRAPVASGSTAAAGSSAPLDPRIATLAQRHPGETLQAIVQFNAPVSQTRAHADAARVHGRVIGNLPIIHGLALELTAAQARSLAGNPDVHAVSLNTTVATQSLPAGFHIPMMPGSQGVSSASLQTTYDETLGVTPLWKFGVTGTGVGVAVIDTGVDGSLPDFAGTDGHSRVIVSAVDNQNATTATDGYGHGTDVAGIIAGNGDNRPASDPLHGQYIGVAPNANLISLKVSDESGNATVLDVIYALQFAVDHQAQYNIRVVNLSLDSATPQSYKTDPLDAAVEAAWMHGIVVVVAAGNRGNTPGAVNYSPANDPYVITVGGVDENGSDNPTGDTIASWSSQGTTQDGFQKPDVYAPGAHIVSVLAPGSVFANSNCGCLVGDGQYIQTSGTSMAAPAISGLVADLLQIHPRWTPDQVKGVLTSPAVSENASFQEPNAVKAALDWNPPVADQNLTPSNLLQGGAGNVNPQLATWSLATWSRATGLLRAGYTDKSYDCTTCSAPTGGSVNSSLATWNLATWNTVSMG